MRKAIRLSPLFHTAGDGKVDRGLGTMLCHDKSVSGAQWWYYMGGGGRSPPHAPKPPGGLAGWRVPAGAMLCLRDLYGYVPCG